MKNLDILLSFPHMNAAQREAALQKVERKAACAAEMFFDQARTKEEEEELNELGLCTFCEQSVGDTPHGAALNHMAMCDDCTEFYPCECCEKSS